MNPFDTLDEFNEMIASTYKPVILDTHCAVCHVMEQAQDMELVEDPIHGGTELVCSTKCKAEFYHDLLASEHMELGYEEEV